MKQDQICGLVGQGWRYGWDKRNKLQREKFKATALDRGQDFVGLT